jgi:hypothetical protein
VKRRRLDERLQKGHSVGLDTESGSAVEPKGLREMAQRKQWSEYSPAAKTAIVIGGIAELVVTTLALRDLIRRPANQVRGWKPLWFLGCLVQPIGSPLYLVAGRRRSHG